jgi:hypothetical protein
MNRRTIALVFASLFVLGATPCFAAEGVALPLPPQAKEVRNMNPEGAWLQTSYVVEAKYPDAFVAQFYLSNVKAPWSQCFAEIPKWDSFGDVSNGNNRYVHQILMHWINRKERKLLLVAMRYYSTGSETRCEPENSSQYVAVAEYPEQDIEQAIELLKLKCEK